MSETIFSVIHERLLKWPELHPDGSLDLVRELIQIQGQIVLSVSIGAEYVDRELPFYDYETGQTKMLAIGNFFNAVLGQGMIRDSQVLNIIFSELLPYCITPHDLAYKKNVKTIIGFFKEVRDAKLAQIKQGKVGIDLFSILLKEGGDAYSKIAD